MMKSYTGDAHLSLEGDLSKCNLSHLEGVSGEETSALRRHTAYPKQDFVVIPLSEATMELILAAVLPDNRYMKDIIYIQIESQGSLVFGTYDNFHRECIVFYDEARAPWSSACTKMAYCVHMK